MPYHQMTIEDNCVYLSYINVGKRNSKNLKQIIRLINYIIINIIILFAILAYFQYNK